MPAPVTFMVHNSEADLSDSENGDKCCLASVPAAFGDQHHRARSKEGSDMLVLSRKLGEKIYISENICITVVDIDRGKIRLGIEAPREVPIFRQELLQDKPPATASGTAGSASAVKK
jgi:carbon storage regulator